MKIKSIKIKFVLLVLFGLNSSLFHAQFPYFNSGQKKGDFTLLGESRTGLVTYDRNGIKLLDAQHQYSGVYLNNLTFTTSKGFILEFEYGLDIGRMEDKKYGDGIAMVLFNANERNPQLGDKGGALGYAYTKKYGSNHTPGFTQGIFGLGLDLFGNYKKITRGDNEIRNGLTLNPEGNFVVLRGPYSVTSTSEGYPVLFAVGTRTNTNLYLDRNTGKVISKQKGLIGQRFSLRGGVLNASSGETGYRKARISLVPGREDSSGQEGFFISVDIVNDSYISSIILNYFVPKAGSIKYEEQMIDGMTPTAINSMSMMIPSTMKMAFTGSTGAASVRAHIRNISLSLPFSPQVIDIVIPNVIYNRVFAFKPLYSAVGYDSNVYSVLNPPNPSTLFLDLDSFRFKLFNANTKAYTVHDDPHHLVVPKVGDFQYNSSSGEVIFSPVEGFKDKSYTLYYDIKNKRPPTGVDISAEEYRSTTAAVTLNFTSEIPLYRNPPLLVNKGVKTIK
ncbi:hypothetical protein [Myroides odoratus]|uniref:hypothetical protein n=1 Tax=Myroides odoratus TaxID=256 RepID=UPI0039AEEEC9